MPDRLYHAAGRMLLAFAAIDTLIEAQTWLHQISVIVSSAADPDNVTSDEFDAAPMTGEARFSYRLKALRKIHANAAGDPNHMSALDAWLGKIRAYELLRGCLAHGMLSPKMSTAETLVFNAYEKASGPSDERVPIMQSTSVEKILLAACDLEGMRDQLLGFAVRLNADYR
jgi:hypothetical protein